MVEHISPIDDIFSALADPVRRDILERTAENELTVNQIAIEYDMSLAAVSKHLKVLADAGLVTRRKAGRFIFVRTNRNGITTAFSYLTQYEELWSNRLHNHTTGIG